MHGYAVALKESARAGHSEHQLGTTLDFKSYGGRAPWDYTDWGTTTAGKWLKANAWKYGFVMSYPKCKTTVTCYTYEPWHYRYVGRTQAAALRASQLTLREFLWNQQNPTVATPSTTVRQPVGIAERFGVARASSPARRPRRRPSGEGPAADLGDELIRRAMVVGCHEHAGGPAVHRDQDAPRVGVGRRRAHGEFRHERPGLDAGTRAERATVTDEEQVAIGHDQLAADGGQGGGDFLAWLEDGLESGPRVLGQCIHGGDPTRLPPARTLSRARRNDGSRWQECSPCQAAVNASRTIASAVTTARNASRPSTAPRAIAVSWSHSTRNASWPLVERISR